MPLLSSTLPFSVDGFSLLRISQGILGTGSWSVDPSSPNAYNEQMPGFSMVWAMVSGLAGVDPLVHVQALLPFVTATSVLPGYLIGRRACGSRLAAFGAGLFLAVFGSFLSVTAGTAKEALAILVFPVAVLLFAERADPRKRGLAFALFLVLPLLHHLTTLLALGAAAALVVLAHHRAAVTGRFSLRALLVDVATGPALAAVAYAYYAWVGLAFLTVLVSPDGLALFLAVAVVLAALLAPSWRSVRMRRGRPVVSPAGRILVVPALAFGLLALDARTEVFAGTLGAQPALLPVASASAVLAGFAFLGWQLLRRTTNRGNDLVLAFLVAPTSLFVFALLRGLDPLSFAIAYRAFDFLDLALGVLVGAGFAFAAARLRSSRAAVVGLGAVLLGVLLATTPLTYNSEATLGVRNVTTPGEFQALAYLANLHATGVATDEPLADVASWWFGLPASSLLPFVIRDNASLSGYAYAVVEDSWTTVGAQVHPTPNVVIPPAVLEAFLAAHRVLYVAGPAGDRVYVVQLSP